MSQTTNASEYAYLRLMNHTLLCGHKMSNRTGIDTISSIGHSLKFDLREGFPALTTKKLHMKAVVGELIGFLRGYTNAADFRALGCNIWDQNANENPQWLANPYRKGLDDLGRIYGAQWRDYYGCHINNRYNKDIPATGYAASVIDQIYVALTTLRTDPQSRRNVVTAWNPAELNDAALPPCHVMFQLIVDNMNGLHLCMYQRSADLFLGVPFNIASYALLLSLFAAWSGRVPKTLTMNFGDLHIYTNHIPQCELQLTREPMTLPTLFIAANQYDQTATLEELLANLEPNSVRLDNYTSHPTIKADMAV